MVEATRTSNAPFEVKLGDEQTEFSGSVRMMTEVANSFGVNLTAQERKDWQTLGRAAYVIDQYLDAEKDTHMSNISPELFSGRPIPGIPEEFSNDCREWLERQTGVRQAEINRQLTEIRLLVEAQAAATTASGVVAVRRREADLLADMLSLRPENREDARAREKFNSWLTVAMRAGYLLDSLRDIKEDYESGASGLKPGPVTSGKMAAYLLRETVVAARVSPRALGKGALVMMRYEIKRMHPDFSKSDVVI
jgi:hypothetical protein